MRKSNAKEMLKKISEKYFLKEPLLFEIFCTHELKENTDMIVPIRCGNKRIEYNPIIMQEYDEAIMERFLRRELFRILLKHPFKRKPDPFDAKSALMASDCVIDELDNTDNYHDKKNNLSYEEHYKNFYKERQKESLYNESNSNSGNTTVSIADDKDSNNARENYASASYATDATQLWNEDILMQEKINSKISTCQNWGSIPGSMINKIKAGTKKEINNKSILKQFKSNVFSNKRCLTRMRPNRRTDFDYMGSKFSFAASILVAVDTSGSVSNKQLEDFLGAVNRIFKYGIEKLDLVFFDTEIQGSPESLKKPRKNYTVKGRGGTNFQCIIDYAAGLKKYSGIIIFTDGYAPSPEIPKNFSAKLAWVCTDKFYWEDNHFWMDKLGSSCWLE